ncbi:MAG: sulfotransferase [Acidobacteriota bacterium]|nr:sulfotransferase [Blastocatellia bacterium]MDW8240062.1 sulfotransferase [Acidobacteriota bacterium]
MGRPSTDATIEQIKLPWLLRAVNWMAERKPLGHRSWVDLSEAGLLNAAERIAGLSDWGDEEFQPQFRLLLETYQNDADLTLIGRLMIRQMFLRMLFNRLRIQDTLKRHPDIRAIPIRRPIFIIGLPRTGTTLLHNLLAQDPSARVPRYWELLYPCPLVVGQPPAKDPRRRRIQIVNWMIRQSLPALRRIHLSGALDPEECIILLQNQFIDFLPLGLQGGAGYRHWLVNHDMIPDYRYYRRQLQLLLSRQFGEPCILKSPCHLFWLDALLTVFPDASLVWTHRDPQKVIPSMCSLAAAYRKLGSNRVELSLIGERVVSMLRLALSRAIEVRERANPSQFLDVDYHALMADPIGTVQHIYQFFDYPYSAAMQRGMKRWLDAHPQYKHGVHRYSPDTFGLSRATIDQQFGEYSRRFDIKPE